MRMDWNKCLVCLTIPLLAFAGTGCRWVVVPEEYEREVAKARSSRFISDKESLPDLNSNLTLAKCLAYAFSNNGDFEAAYHEWRAALERVPQAGALEDPRMEFGVLFSTENVKTFSDAFDELSAGLSQELPGPGKRAAKARQALKEAQASGERFRAAKYDLQTRVTEAYARLWLNEALEDLRGQTVDILAEGNDLALGRFEVMAEDVSLNDIQKFQIEIARTETEQRELQIARPSIVAELNSLLNRESSAPFGSPQYPKISDPVISEEVLFARAVERNSDLAAVRRDIEALGAAEALARLQTRPDFMVSGMIEYPLLVPSEALMPTLGFGMTLPLNRERIRAGIAEATAQRKAAEARYRSARYDTMSQLLIALTGLRDTQRVEQDYQSKVIPASESLLDTQLTTYGSGGGDILEILDTERLLIDFRQVVLQARADRLQYIARLEEILAEDLFH